MTHTALYAGSFDPPTNGHLWVIAQALEMFEDVIVAVAHNPAKRGAIQPEERIEILNAERRYRFGQRMEVLLAPSSRYVADVAQQYGARFLIRGIRGAEDLQHEQGLRDFAETRGELTTVFLMPPPALRGLSSSYVRALVGPHGWEDVVRPLVPAATLTCLAKGARS